MWSRGHYILWLWKRPHRACCALQFSLLPVPSSFYLIYMYLLASADIIKASKSTYNQSVHMFRIMSWNCKCHNWLTVHTSFNSAHECIVWTSTVWTNTILAQIHTVPFRLSGESPFHAFHENQEFPGFHGLFVNSKIPAFHER